MKKKQAILALRDAVVKMKHSTDNKYVNFSQQECYKFFCIGQKEVKIGTIYESKTSEAID